jgi:diketogulonate reductase-like aldo/keto reductase
MAFKKSDVNNFVTNYIVSELVSKKIQPSSLDIKYTLNERDLENGNISFDLEIRANVYSPMNEDKLKEELANKSVKEAEIVLNSLEEITDSNIDLWPFWINKIPKNSKKINISFDLE